MSFVADSNIAVVGSGFAGLAFTLTYLEKHDLKENPLIIAPSAHNRHTTALLTSKAVEWFHYMGLKEELEESLAEPAVMDLVYVKVDGEHVDEIAKKKKYLYNPYSGKLLNIISSEIKRRKVPILRDRLSHIGVADDGIILFTENNNIVKSRILVEATGSSKAVLSSLGIRPPSITIYGYQLYASLDDKIQETFFYYNSKGSFNHTGWIIPRGNTLWIGAASVVGSGNIVDEALVLDSACSVLSAYGYKCPAVIKGGHYVHVRVPVGLKSFVFDVGLPGGHVLAVGEAGGFITPRNGEGIPYALWTGTYAALHVDDPGGYRRVVCREIVEKELLPKIRETREFYKGIHGVDPLEYVSSQADSVRVGDCSG